VYVDRPRRTLGEVSPVNETGGHLWSCNFVIDCELFARLGGFNEAFPYACLEDVDLRLRLTKRGEAIVFVREAAVCHPWRPSKGWQAIRQYQQSVAVFLREHPEMAHRINRGYYLKRALMNLRDLSRFGLFNPLEIQAVIPDFVGNLQMCLRPVRRSSG
jgi:GT2 family glycosyltransferase